MAKDQDVMRCVVMGRDKPSHDWSDKSLIVITERKSVAWRSAYSIQKQERAHGNPKYEAVVLSEEDFDAGRYRCRLKPPAGFNLEHPSGPPRVTELVEVKAPAPVKEETEGTAKKKPKATAKAVKGAKKNQEKKIAKKAAAKPQYPKGEIGVTGPPIESAADNAAKGQTGVSGPPIESPAPVEADADALRQQALNDLFS